jgi:hypothetical protein
MGGEEVKWGTPHLFLLPRGEKVRLRGEQGFASFVVVYCIKKDDDCEPKEEK